MADPKKPTARANSAKKTTTAKKSTPAKKTAPAAKKPTAAKRPPRAPKPEVIEELERFDEQDEEAARPVAIRGIEDFQDDDDDIVEDQPALASPAEAYGATMDESTPVPAGIEDLGGADDRSGSELLAGLASLALAASTFLPWYRGSVGNLSGFASGSYGPLVTFLGLAGFLIVLLRRLKVPVSLPLETGVILEGIGWVSVGAIMVKRIFGYKVGAISLPLSDPYFLKVFNGLMISLMCAVAIAILAGRLSTGSPFVVRPKWFAGSAGKIGAAILVMTLVGGVTAGFMAPGDPSADIASPAEPETKRYENRLPKCLSDIPVPRGAKIIGGAEQFRNGERFYCQGSIAYGSSIAKAEAAFLKLWRADGIRFRPASQKIKGSSLILMEKPCGLLSVTQPNKKKPATVNITLIPDKGCPYAPGVVPPTR